MSQCFRKYTLIYKGAIYERTYINDDLFWDSIAMRVIKGMT